MVPQTQKAESEKPLTPVMEDYLETLYDLDMDKRAIRVKDIAKRLNVKMPTVTSMLKILNERGLINYQKYEYVELTDEGTSIGKEMRRRHEIFLKFLMEVLKVDFNSANEEACKMEHTLSPETMASLTDFMEFIQTCPRAGESWLSNFEEYRKHGRRPNNCDERIEDFSGEFKQKTRSIRKKTSGKKKA